MTRPSGDAGWRAAAAPSGRPGWPPSRRDPGRAGAVAGSADAAPAAAGCRLDLGARPRRSTCDQHEDGLTVASCSGRVDGQRGQVARIGHRRSSRQPSRSPSTSSTQRRCPVGEVVAPRGVGAAQASSRLGRVERVERRPGLAQHRQGQERAVDVDQRQPVPVLAPGRRPGGAGSSMRRHRTASRRGHHEDDRRREAVRLRVGVAARRSAASSRSRSSSSSSSRSAQRRRSRRYCASSSRLFAASARLISACSSVACRSSASARRRVARERGRARRRSAPLVLRALGELRSSDRCRAFVAPVDRGQQAVARPRPALRQLGPACAGVPRRRSPARGSSAASSAPSVLPAPEAAVLAAVQPPACSTSSCSRDAVRADQHEPGERADQHVFQRRVVATHGGDPVQADVGRWTPRRAAAGSTSRPAGGRGGRARRRPGPAAAGSKVTGSCRGGTVGGLAASR